MYMGSITIWLGCTLHLYAWCFYHMIASCLRPHPGTNTFQPKEGAATQQGMTPYDLIPTTGTALLFLILDEHVTDLNTIGLPSSICCMFQIFRCLVSWMWMGRCSQQFSIYTAKGMYRVFTNLTSYFLDILYNINLQNSFRFSLDKWAFSHSSQLAPLICSTGRVKVC